jgi:hypothetical protein
MADVDGDGDLDLFAGGRALPGRYPESSASQNYRFENGRLTLDTNISNALRSAGIVNGAVWSDLTGDGLPELIIACEWGPIRVFKNDGGRSLHGTLPSPQLSTLNSQLFNRLVDRRGDRRSRWRRSVGYRRGELGPQR